MSQKKNIVVTGGAGFIGSHIVAHHLENGDHVWAVDNLQTGRLKNVESFQGNPKFLFDQDDVCTWQKLSEAVKWADKIYHMAATVGQRMVLGNSVSTITNNIQGCASILKAMDDAGSKARLIIASTSEVYCHLLNHIGNHLSEDAILNFTSGQFLQETYPVSKYVNEVMTLSYVFQRGLDCTIARIFNTIGVNQSSAYGMVLPNFIEQALAQKPLTVYGDGLQTRSFCNVKDTVMALNLLLDNPESKGKVINVGDDHECSIIDLAKLVIKKAKSKSEITFTPYKEAYGVDFTDVRKRCPDLHKLQQLTGFRPQFNLEQTIEIVINASK